MKKVVVLGSDHVNTLGIIRSLGEAGLRPTAIIVSDESKCWTAKSKYIGQLIITSSKKDEITDALIKAKIENEKIYLIPCGDPYTKLIDENFDLLSRFYIIPNLASSPGALSRIMDKKLMCEAAENTGGFKLPKTLYFKVPESGEINSADFSAFDGCFPLIMRNGESVPNTDGNIYIVKNEAELLSALEKKRGITVIIQKYIEKDEEIGIQGVGFGKDEEPVVSGIVHKIRTAEVGSIGSTCYAVIAPAENEEIVKATKKFIQGIGYDGIYDIELLREGSDYYFVECNFRNGAYGYSFTKAGANLPLIWIERGKNCDTQVKDELTLMNETADMKHIMKNVSVFKWIAQFISADIHLTLNKKDLKPFIGRILSK